MNDMSAHPAPKSDWAANLPVPPRPAPPRPTMGAQSSGIAWSLIAAFALHGAALAALTGLNLATGSDPKPLSVITVDLVALTPSAPAGGSAAGEADTDTDTPANEATDKTESPSAPVGTTSLPPDPVVEPTPTSLPEPAPVPEPAAPASDTATPEPVADPEPAPAPPPPPVAEVATLAPAVIPTTKPVPPSTNSPVAEARPQTVAKDTQTITPPPVPQAQKRAASASTPPPTPTVAAAISHPASGGGPGDNGIICNGGSSSDSGADPAQLPYRCGGQSRAPLPADRPSPGMARPGGSGSGR